MLRRDSQDHLKKCGPRRGARHSKWRHGRWRHRSQTQTLPFVSVYKENSVGTQPCPFVHIFSLAAARHYNRAIYVLSGLLQKKICSPLCAIRLRAGVLARLSFRSGVRSQARPLCPPTLSFSACIMSAFGGNFSKAPSHLTFCVYSLYMPLPPASYVLSLD